MLFRLLLAPVVIASLAAVAHAQAPGEVVPMTPATPPPVAGAPVESVMAHRWAVGFGVGSLSVAPDSMPDAKSQFAVGELNLRFRATPHLDLEVAFFGGREQLPDTDKQGDREANAGYLGARYRFAIEQPWNWWLMMGLGGMSVAPHDATDQQRKDAQRPIGVAGLGLERRWHHFALNAELRYVGVGKKDEMDRQEHQSGGTFTLGASYYF